MSIAVNFEDELLTNQIFENRIISRKRREAKPQKSAVMVSYEVAGKNSTSYHVY